MVESPTKGRPSSKGADRRFRIYCIIWSEHRDFVITGIPLAKLCPRRPCSYDNVILYMPDPPLNQETDTRTCVGMVPISSNRVFVGSGFE